MHYRHLFPIVRILLPFMAGIIVCITIRSNSFFLFFTWLVLIPLIIGLESIKTQKLGIYKKQLFGVLLNLFLLLSGYNSVILHKEIASKHHFARIQQHGLFIARVIEPPQEKEHSYKAVLKVEGLINANKQIKAEGRILTYFSKDSIKKPPVEGTLITFSGNVSEISPPLNPGSFNYKKYMEANNVYHQIYLKSQSWRILKLPTGLNVIRMAHTISEKFISLLKKGGLKGQEFAVASALLLGQNDMLDNETIQAYAGSGVMHILSVSGLHVGIIYLIVNFLLGFLKKKGSQLYIKTVMLILIIWAYALLTGLSPSVMRAATMFSFITIGNASNRNVHIINSLATSALILLLIDPLMISNVGFQLSYIAIIGIVFINKPLTDLWYPSSWLVRHIWNLITISIAAQIATAPMVLFYFHQFPAYFLPANLIAIDLSFFAIVSGLGVLVTSVIPTVSNLLAVITNSLIQALNWSMNYIEDLPNAVIYFSSFSTKVLLLLYIILISILLLFYFKRKEMLILILVLAVILSINVSYTEDSRQKQKKIVFYSVGKQNAIGFIDGKEQCLLADALVLMDKKAKSFSLAGAINYYGIDKTHSYSLDSLIKIAKNNTTNIPIHTIHNHILYYNKRIAVVEHIPKIMGNSVKLEVDYLLIRYNSKVRISDILAQYKPKTIIITGAGTKQKEENWRLDCKKAGIRAVNLKEEGAFIAEL